MANTKGLVPICLVFLCILMSAHDANAAISCGQVVSYLSPCIAYVAQGGLPASNCCNGVKTLYGLSQTTQERQSVCRCLKSAVSSISYSSFNLNNAATLPAKCGVNLPYKISPSTNCDTII